MPGGVVLLEQINLCHRYMFNATLQTIFDSSGQTVIRPRWGRKCCGEILSYQDSTPDRGLNFTLFLIHFSFAGINVLN